MKSPDDNKIEQKVTIFLPTFFYGPIFLGFLPKNLRSNVFTISFSLFLTEFLQRTIPPRFLIFSSGMPIKALY